MRLKAVRLITVMGDTVDGQVRGITGRVERMEIREKEHRLPGNSSLTLENEFQNFGTKS